MGTSYGASELTLGVLKSPWSSGAERVRSLVLAMNSRPPGTKG